MKTLVTGGGGFVGGAIARALLEAGHEVHSVGRSPQPRLESQGILHHQVDLADAEAVYAVLDGLELVFHVAARVGLEGDRRAFFRANVEGTDNVIEGCRRAGVGRLVFTSTPSVVIGHDDIEGGDESLPYLKRYSAFYPESKAEAERRVRAAHGPDLRTVCLRPHIVYGPGDTSFLPRLLERAPRLKRIGPGGKKTDLSFIDDVVQAHLQAAEALKTRPEVVGGQAYFVTGGEPVEIWEAIDRLLDAAGGAPVEGRIPRGVAMTAAWVGETLHRLGGYRGEPRLHRWVVEELTSSHWFDGARARRDLGYTPAVSFAEGLERVRADRRPMADAR